MKIGIICAMEEELNAVEESLASLSTLNNYKNSQLHLELSGIGKVNAAMSTQKLINKVKLDYIINIGVAGNISNHLNFGDVVIAKDLVYHDMDVTGFGMKLGQVPRMDVFAFPCANNLLTLSQSINPQSFKIEIGRIASGDQFINNKAKAMFIYNEFGAVACEMEGAAVAHVCYTNNVPVLVVRSISDKAGCGKELAEHSYNQLKDMAAARASFIIKSLLEKLYNN